MAQERLGRRRAGFIAPGNNLNCCPKSQLLPPRPLPLTLTLSREKEKKKKNAFCLQCPNHKIKRISIRQLMSNCCKKMKKSKKKKRERSAKQARKWLFPPEPFVTAVITSPFNPPIPPAGGQLSCHNAVPPD